MVLSKALRAATRGVSTSAGARMALPALTAAVPKPSMMSAIFGGSAGPAMPPMDQPVPGLAVPDPPAAPAAVVRAALAVDDDRRARDARAEHRRAAVRGLRAVEQQPLAARGHAELGLDL